MPYGHKKKLIFSDSVREEKLIFDLFLKDEEVSRLRKKWGTFEAECIARAIAMGRQSSITAILQRW